MQIAPDFFKSYCSYYELTVMPAAFVRCPAVEVSVPVGRRGTEEEVSPSLSSSDPRPTGRGEGMLVLEMSDHGCGD